MITNWGLLIAVFVACCVEMVEAATIVMAMGFTRSWKSALAGTGSALIALTAMSLLAGYAITSWLPEAALQLAIGTLLLIFGLQWLRKAILRSSGRKAEHDEAAIYQAEVSLAKQNGQSATGLDMFSFMVSFKGVFLEGMEVVFIVITFGLNAHNISLAALAAGTSLVVVLAVAIVVRKPLSMIPENLLKYIVGLLLASFGTYWAVEGIGVFRPENTSLTWPGKDLSVVVLLLSWLLLSRLFILILKIIGKKTELHS